MNAIDERFTKHYFLIPLQKMMFYQGEYNLNWHHTFLVMPDQF